MKHTYQLVLSLFSVAAMAQSSFLPTASDAPIANRGVVTQIVASIPYQGYDETQAYYGEGEYEIFLDNLDGVLDKPIIILDGFDPGDGRDITGLYNSLEFDGQNMADIIRDEGFDIVVLNAPLYNTGGKDIDGGSDYIQRNAMVLVEMIETLNNLKVGNEELVILGPSMGGLIGRYGLSYMEQNSLDHETRLYLSFDSPHRGANIPISLQYLINYLADQSGDPDAQAIIDQVLRSPAAKEMLLDHLDAHLLPGSVEQDPTKLLPEGAPNFRDAFQSELDALGFPVDVRNVTMVNGSSLGTTTGTPGMQVVDTTIEIAAFTDAEITLHFTPPANQTINVTHMETFLFGVPVALFDALGESDAASDGVDASPGGTGNISSALGGGGVNNPVIVAFIAALDQDEYSFIPLISALAIDNEDDWFAVPDIGGIHNSPFVNVFMPEVNEDHVAVTAASANFALEEIRNGVLSTSEIELETMAILAQNPVGSEIVLKLDSNFDSETLGLSIYTNLGQEVFSTTIVNPVQEVTINHDLATGMYLVRLDSGKAIKTLKMVVR